MLSFECPPVLELQGQGGSYCTKSNRSAYETAVFTQRLDYAQDGKCLYRAVSRALLYGTEDMHKLLCLMTTMEIARHQASYDPKRADFFSDLEMYVPGYTETLQAASTLGTASELLHLYAVSAAARRPIMSTCPLAHDHLKPLTALVVGRNVLPNLPPVNIIWTSAHELQDLYQFTLNHFVVLHPMENACTVQPMPCLHIPRLSSTDQNNQHVHDSLAEEPSSTGDVNNDIQDPEGSSDDEGSASATSVTDSSDAADFRIVKGATQHGKDLLVSTTGYSYTIRTPVKVSFWYSAFLWKRHRRNVVSA